jgi:hypothetical protein
MTTPSCVAVVRIAGPLTKDAVDVVVACSSCVHCGKVCSSIVVAVKGAMNPEKPADGASGGGTRADTESRHNVVRFSLLPD